MPIFEYICKECGYRFEKLDRAGAAQVDCPACGSLDVKKEISSFASGTTSHKCAPSSSGG